MEETLEYQKEYFSPLARKYDKTVSERYVYTPVKQELLRCLKQEISVNRDMRLLDVACGTGKLLELAIGELSLKPKQLAGIDLSEAMIEEAKDKSSLKGAKLVKGNANELPWEDGKFDVVTTTFSFHHFASKQSLAEIRRVLKSDGVLAIADLCPPPWLSAQTFDRIMIFLSKCRVGGYRNQNELREFLAENGFKTVYQRRTKGLVLLTLGEKE